MSLENRLKAQNNIQVHSIKIIYVHKSIYWGTILKYSAVILSWVALRAWYLLLVGTLLEHVDLGLFLHFAPACQSWSACFSKWWKNVLVVATGSWAFKRPRLGDHIPEEVLPLGVLNHSNCLVKSTNRTCMWCWLTYAWQDGIDLCSCEVPPLGYPLYTDCKCIIRCWSYE